MGEEFEGLIADDKRSPTSLDTYRRSLKNHIRPALGELRIGEATTPRIDTALTKIKTTAGASTAKTCRAIISGAMKLAVRYGAITVNPVREVDTIEAPPKDPPRALTGEEVTLLRRSLSADGRAVEADLPQPACRAEFPCRGGACSGGKCTCSRSCRGCASARGERPAVFDEADATAAETSEGIVGEGPAACA